MKNITNIELTNVCNRSCSFCGIPYMTRSKGFMSEEVFDRVVDLLVALEQDSVNIIFYGESTLHPRLLEYCKKLNDNNILPCLTTNGDYLTKELILELSTIKLKELVISPHAPLERRNSLLEQCKISGIESVRLEEEYIEEDATLNLRSDREVPQKLIEKCPFLVKERAVVLWDGRVTACCVDYDGLGVFSNVFDPNILELKPIPFKSCNTCDLIRKINRLN